MNKNKNLKITLVPKKKKDLSKFKLKHFEKSSNKFTDKQRIMILVAVSIVAIIFFVAMLLVVFLVPK